MIFRYFFWRGDRFCSNQCGAMYYIKRHIHTYNVHTCKCVIHMHGRLFFNSILIALVISNRSIKISSDVLRSMKHILVCLCYISLFSFILSIIIVQRYFTHRWLRMQCTLTQTFALKRSFEFRFQPMQSYTCAIFLNFVLGCRQRTYICNLHYLCTLQYISEFPL